jgi:hypothetical protein
VAKAYVQLFQEKNNDPVSEKMKAQIDKLPPK